MNREPHRPAKHGNTKLYEDEGSMNREPHRPAKHGNTKLYEDEGSINREPVNGGCIDSHTDLLSMAIQSFPSNSPVRTCFTRQLDALTN